MKKSKLISKTRW